MRGSMMVSAMSDLPSESASRGSGLDRGAAHPLGGVLARQGDYTHATQIGQ
jgi:hypothetical protein